ncbi:MAG: serine protease [Ruminococcus sp.]|nr:serine protease [Ruminococcus sp.]
MVKRMIKTNFFDFKKCIAFFTAILMIVWVFSYTTNNYSDAANSSLTYRVYNAKTGGLLRTYTLAPLETDDNSRAVINTDDRVIDWTKSGVVKILTKTSSISSFGSGFVVGKHTIATAAHCLYGYADGTPRSVSEVLLFDTSGNVSLRATPVEYHVPTKFINAVSDETYHAISDYALITVKEDLSAYMCFDLGVPTDSFKNKNATVTVTGFPYEYNSSTKHMKYSGNGKIKKLPDEYDDNNLLFYDTDTSKGNSGGPVFLTESLRGETYYTVVAINVGDGSYEENGKEYPINAGMRITTDLIHFYKSNKNLNY